MIKNYFLVAFRNLRKNLVYSILNITGLAIGIAAALLIYLWVFHESTYDDFIPKRDRIFQVWLNAEFDGTINTWNSVPLPTYKAMKEANVHIKESVVTGWGSNHLLTYGEKRMNRDGLFASEEFLEMFEYELLEGEADQVMDEPKSIVITESLAKDIFGKEEALGKVIQIDDNEEVVVTGILKDLSSNSTLQFDYLLPWKFREITEAWVRENGDSWGNFSFQVYIELDDPSNQEAVTAVVENMIMENGEGEIPNSLFLYPMERWHLYSSFENGEESGGLAVRVKLFSAIALFILIIACINFMNLATARSESRAREVGIRKSVGSGRRELILQFLGESILITWLSFLIALVIVKISLPFFNDLIGKSLFIDISEPLFWGGSIALILFTGILSGSYPAFYLSSFQPSRVLKGEKISGKGGNMPRKILVTTQFVISVIMIIGTIIVYQQIQLVKSRELGYNQERLISVRYNDEIRKNFDVIKQELERSPSVESVTRSNSDITSINSNNFLDWPGKPDDLRVLFITIVSGYDYTKTFGVKVLEGRDFSRDYASDSSAIIINKAAAELMDLEEPIGAQLDLWGEKRTLIGIIDNVLMGSVFTEARPLFMIPNQDWYGTVSIRLSGNGELNANLKEVENIFRTHNPAYPFEYQFVDEQFNEKFKVINQTSELASVFAMLTFIITGLGLLGLASFMAEQRTKEIGIRKVMGASVQGLIFMMTRDFTLLVLVALAIAFPSAYFLMDLYLEQYPVRTNIELWVFPVTGLITLLFAVVVIAAQAWKAAASNPVKSIRN